MVGNRRNIDSDINHTIWKPEEFGEGLGVQLGEDEKDKPQKVRRIAKVMAGCLGVGLLLGLGWMIGRGEGSWERKIISPWSGWREQKTENEKAVEVVGFLPSWMVGKTRIYGNEISQLVFLGIEVEESGKLVWDTQGKKINSEEYTKVKKGIKKAGGKNILGIKQFKDKTIETFLKNNEARKKLIEELKVVVRGNFDGINVDFEFQNSPYKVTEDEFISFVEELKGANLGEISVDVFANTLIKGETEKVRKLVDKSDRVIVMGYDFHRPGSQYAGPVAPLDSPVGKRNLGEVVERVNRDQLERKKVILALPFYGYEWQTETEEFGARVSKSGAQMASWVRAGKLAQDGRYKIYDLRWETGQKMGDLKPGEMKIYYDKESQSPWLVYKNEVTRVVNQRVKVGRSYRIVPKTVVEEEIYQVYYEDLQSLGAKFDLAMSNKLGGIGFWALGYEGEEQKVWNLVKEKIKANGLLTWNE
jgi:spore germination protein YaaH